MKNPDKTKQTLKMAIIPIIVVTFLFAFIYGIFVFNGGPKTPATIEQVENAIREQGFEPIDSTEFYKNDDSEIFLYRLNRSVSIQIDDIDFTFFDFKSDTGAEEVRGIHQSYINTERYGVPNVEISEGYSNYVAYTLTTHGTYSLNVRVGNTLVFATSDEESAAQINDIMRAIGYFKPKENNNNSLNLSLFDIDLIVFVLAFVVVMIISIFAIKKQWKKDNRKIKIVTEAEITDKQNKRRKYYVTFKLLGGDSIKLRMSEQEYDRLDIGYYGKVTFNDKTYLGFERGYYA